MAEVTRSSMLEAGMTVKLLSVLVAALLWLSVIMERPGETKLIVPVVPENLPAGLALAAPPPAKVMIGVAGPRILLPMLRFTRLSCRMDLGAAQPGTTVYLFRQSSLRLPDGKLQVVSISPAAVPVTLARR